MNWSRVVFAVVVLFTAYLLSQQTGVPNNSQKQLRPVESGARVARSALFNDRSGKKPALDERQPTVAFSEFPQPVRTEPLPTSQSNVVVLGQLLDATSYVSTDRTAIYSEFRFSVEQSFKNDTQETFESIDVVRRGGTVVLPDGRATRDRFPIKDRQFVKGHRYLMFLTYQPKAKCFFTIKVWELQNSKVIPVSFDEVRAATKGQSEYTGMNETSFLTRVAESVNH